jgi:cytochrome c peroxidase
MEERMFSRRSTWLDTALALAAVLPVIGGCGGSKMDGFSNEDWERITAIAPMSQAMPENPFDKMGTDTAIAKFGQRIFWDKRGAEAIVTDGPSGKGPYTPIDSATGLPAVDPVTMAPKVIPGEKGKVSCGTCHGSPYLIDSRTGYTTSHGRTWLGHNTPTMTNLGYMSSILWTGRFDSLREHGTTAMSGNSSTLAQIHYIFNNHKDEYNRLFPDTPLPDALDPTAMDAARFPSTGNAKGAAVVNGKTIMSADGVYEKMTREDRLAVAKFRGNMGIVFEAHPRMLNTPGAPFEQYVRDQDSTALSESAKNGLRLFIGKASCIDCHNGPALTDNQFHNIGVPTQTFAPGTTNPGVPDRGRGGALVGGLNNQLMQLRTNDKIPDVLDQVMIFGGAGQFSSDNPAIGRQRLEDLDKASCVTRSLDMADITTACQALFYPGAPGDDTKTPPVAAKPADPRLDTCVTANTAAGVCTKYDDSFEGSFRTPMLLNVAQTAPYFHTGELKTLREVVVHYNNGGGANGSYVGTKSERLRPLGLTDNEIGDLVAFLESLTGTVPDPNWTCDLSLPAAATGIAATAGGACAAQ